MVQARREQAWTWIVVLGMMLSTSTAASSVRAQSESFDMEQLATQAASQIDGARATLRRAARDADDPSVRMQALQLLLQYDASPATAKICARILRLDSVAVVRRAAAECLGRHVVDIGVQFTPQLVAALDDESIDVATMAGWSLANVGDIGAIEPLTQKISHPDARAGVLFYDYAERIRIRLGAPVIRAPEFAERPRFTSTVSHEQRVAEELGDLDMSASAMWLGLYGGMEGWLHGGLFVAAHGGSSADSLVALSALGGAALGAAVGAGYSVDGAPHFIQGHTVVQLGALGTVAGFGAALMGGSATQRVGIDAANFSLIGTLVGTGLGWALVEQDTTPSTSALTMGAHVGVGIGLGTWMAARGLGLSEQSSVGTGFLLGGLTAGATTVLIGDQETGVLPIVSSALGGVALASAGGLLFGFNENGQGSAFLAQKEATGMATIAGYAVGSAVGYWLGSLVPAEQDPWNVWTAKVNPASLVWVPAWDQPQNLIPMMQLSGSF